MKNTTEESLYSVNGGDPAGPVHIGRYATFELALKSRDEALKEAKVPLSLHIHNLDHMDYDFDGLTDEQREML